MPAIPMSDTAASPWISIPYGDGWRTDITILDDGMLSVVVSSPAGRSWATEQPTIDQALKLAERILAEQRIATAGQCPPDPPAAASA